MMDLFIFLAAIIALSTFALKVMCERWMKSGLPRWGVAVGAIAALFLVISCGTWVFETIRLMSLAVRGSSAALVTAGAGIMLGGLALKLATVIKPGPLKDFVVESLLFRTGRRQRGGYDGEQAQRALDEHHRTIGELENASRLLGRPPKQRSDPEQLRAELKNAPSVVRSPDLGRELELLGGGTRVELTDSWRLFWFSRNAEEPADQIMMIALDPKTGALAVQLVRDDLDPARRLGDALLASAQTGSR